MIVSRQAILTMLPVRLARLPLLALLLQPRPVAPLAQAAAPPRSASPAARSVVRLMDEADEQQPLVQDVQRLAQGLRRAIEDAEEEVLVEVQHSKKFMWRGKGLRYDFATASPTRRRALLKGVADNERALLAAMKEAQAVGLPPEYMEDALRVANSLAIERAQLEQDYARLGGAGPGFGSR